MPYIVWNGCDEYVETEKAKSRGHDFDGTLLYHGSLAFKPIEVVEIDPKDLPTDEEGQPILDGVLGTETGHFYKAATPQNTEKTTKYFATFNHGENGRGGSLELHATNDEQAKAEVRQFVGQGYRNETRAGVDLSNGTHYQAWNEHGEVKSRTLQGVDISFSPTTKAKEPKATVKSKGPGMGM